MRKPLLFFLVTFFLVSCSDRPPGDKMRHGLPVPSQKERVSDNMPLLLALKELRQDPFLLSASLGYLVIDITGKEPVIVADYHSGKTMIPASTLKIFVTGAALDILGKTVIPEVTITNQMSVNWRSSKLLRRIGGKVFQSATTSAGIRAILDYWEGKGVNTEGMTFYDGNGLSHNNAITPKQLVDALYVMRSSTYFKVFYESLPLAGLTGTLRKAMKGTAAEGRIRAKTGTIGKVKSFAGYVHTVTGRRLVFSLIVNDYECRTRLIKRKLESVLVTMAEI